MSIKEETFMWFMVLEVLACGQLDPYFPGYREAETIAQGLGEIKFFAPMVSRSQSNR